MKRALSVLLALLLVCSLLGGCSKVVDEEAVQPPPVEEESAGLAVVFEPVMGMRRVSAYDGGAYYGAHIDESIQLMKLDFTDMTVSFLNDERLDHIKSSWFFTWGEYLYCIDRKGDTYTYVVSRSALDGSGRVDIELSETWRFGYFICVAADKDGSLYLSFYKENDPTIGLSHSRTKGCCLAKLDFESVGYEILYETTQPTENFDVVGVEGNSIIILLNDKKMQYTLGGEQNGLAEYDGEWFLPDVIAEDVITDPFSNTLYYENHNQQYWVEYADRETGERGTIDFSDTAILDGAFDDEMTEINVSYLPYAAARDGFIVRLGFYNSSPHIFLHIFGYVSREDFLGGSFNVVPFDYSEVIETLN